MKTGIMQDTDAKKGFIALAILGLLVVGVFGVSSQNHAAQDSGQTSVYRTK